MKRAANCLSPPRVFAGLARRARLLAAALVSIDRITLKHRRLIIRNRTRQGTNSGSDAGSTIFTRGIYDEANMVSGSRTAGGLCLGRSANSRIGRIGNGRQQHEYRRVHDNKQHIHFGLTESDRDRRHNRRHDAGEHRWTINHCESRCKHFHYKSEQHKFHIRAEHDGNSPQHEHDWNNDSKRNHRPHGIGRRQLRIDWDHGHERDHWLDRQFARYDGQHQREYHGFHQRKLHRHRGRDLWRHRRRRHRHYRSDRHLQLRSDSEQRHDHQLTKRNYLRHYDWNDFQQLLRNNLHYYTAALIESGETGVSPVSPSNLRENTTFDFPFGSHD